MFKKLFGRRESAAQKSNERKINVAMVLLSKPQLPEGDAIARSFASLTTDRPGLRSRTGEPDGDSPGIEILLLEVDSQSDGMIVLMPIAVPNREADEAARFSISA